MHKRVFIAAAIATCGFACSVAVAAEPTAESLAPTLTVGFHFGNAQRGLQQPHFTAQFDVRSQLLQRDRELVRSSSSPDQPLDQFPHLAGDPLLTLFEFSAKHSGPALVQVLGHDMVATKPE